MSRSASGSRSGSRAGSRSGSGSRSTSPNPSEDSVALPVAPVAPVTDAPAAPQPGVVSLFVGLGPAGRGVKQEEFDAFLRTKTPKPEDVLRVAMRGRSAFVDVANQAVADLLISTLHDQPYNEEVRLTVQPARHTHEEMIERRKAREQEARNQDSGAPRTLVFVGLGPKGGDVSDEALRAKLEAVAPIKSFRRRPQWAIVEFASPEQAQKVIAALHDQMMGECRLAVQISDRAKKTRDREHKDKPGGSGVSKRRRSRRSRSDSRERRRDRDGHRSSRRSRRSRSRSRSRSPRRRYRRRERSVSSSSSYSRRHRSYSRDSRSDSEERRERRRRRR